MKNWRVGNILLVDDISATIVGIIRYKNPDDGNKEWIEYRLITDDYDEYWLSCDEYYKEYSLSRPSSLRNGQIDSKWHKVDEGIQVVKSCVGDVDVEAGDRASFVEFEDETEEETLSVENWDDGSEISLGYYVDEHEVRYLGDNLIKPNKGKSRANLVGIFFIIIVMMFWVVDEFPEIFDVFDKSKTISEYVKSANYTYITSITGNQKEKADVYSYPFLIGDPLQNSSEQGTSQANQDSQNVQTTVPLTLSTDLVAKDIINGIEGETEQVSLNTVDSKDGSISILTKEEYCLIYYPEGIPNTVYVQISNRKYNYTSDGKPYRSRSSTGIWYRSHYYSSGYHVDAGRWKNIPSSYKMYDGPIVKDLGNGYYDVYSNDIRQSSINRRRSSDGGGK